MRPDMSDCGNRGLSPKYRLGLYVPHRSDWSSFPLEEFCAATRGISPARSQDGRIWWQVQCNASPNKRALIRRDDIPRLTERV